MPTSSPPDEQRTKPSPQALVLATLLQHGGNVHLDKLGENLGTEGDAASLDEIEAAYLDLEKSGLLTVDNAYQVTLNLSSDGWQKLSLSLAQGIQALADHLGRGTDYGKKILLAQVVEQVTL